MRKENNKKKYFSYIKILLLILLAVPFMTGCRSKAERMELTNYTGSSVKSFERGTKAKLSEESTGVYASENYLQVMAPEGNITSITVLDGAKKYTMSGISIGMSKTDAEQKLKGTYGAETSKTINSENNSVTYSYTGKKNELYISYGIDNSQVVEMSYYELKSEDKEEEPVTNAGQLIAMVGNIRVYYNEAMVYLKSVQQEYETEYGKDIWNADIFGDGRTFGDHIKDEVIKQITEIKIIDDKAPENQVALTEDEKAEAAAYASEHYKGLSDEDINKYLITEDLLKKVYEDNLLAQKMFDTLTINVDTEVPDAEAKQITVQQIFISSMDTDDKGNKVPMAEDEKQKAYEKVTGLENQAKTTTDFKALAEANSEADTVEYTFGKGTGPKEYGAAFEQAALSLKTGQVSDIVTTDNGWNIIYCVTDFNEDATTQVKENIIDGRRSDMFAKLYTEWSTDYDIVVNNEAWNAVPFSD